MIKAIVAMDEGRVIGNAGDIPWSIPEDLRYFSRETKGDAVFMGRKTYVSLPDAYRPLPKRKNIVATRSAEAFRAKYDVPSEVEVVSDISSFLLSLKDASENIWIIGGAEIYKQTQSVWDELYLTLVSGRHEGDTHFPHFEEEFEEYWREDHPGFSFLRYRRRS